MGCWELAGGSTIASRNECREPKPDMIKAESRHSRKDCKSRKRATGWRLNQIGSDYSDGAEPENTGGCLLLLTIVGQVLPSPVLKERMANGEYVETTGSNLPPNYA